MRQKVINALNGYGGFRLVADNEAANNEATNKANRESAYQRLDGLRAGRFVFWPMRNDARAVWHLLQALAAGSIPIIIPDNLPPHKQQDLLARYPHFDYYTGDQIAARGDSSVVADDSDIFIALATSGSTQTPRIVIGKGSRLAASIQAVHNAQSLDNIASTGAVLPLFFAYGLTNQLLWAVYFERLLWIKDKNCLDIRQALSAMQKNNIEMTCFVNTHAFMLAKTANEVLSHANFRVINFGGSPFPMAEYPLLKRIFPNARFLNNYGCTEAMPRIAVHEVTDTTIDPRCVGKPINGIEVRTESTSAISPILFRGQSVSPGTLNADGTIDSHDEWIAPGDEGFIKNDLLYVCGRYDQIIKRNGERHSLLEVAETLRTLGFTNCTAIFAHEQILVLVEGDIELTPKALRDAFALRLPRTIWPDLIIRATSWPYLGNGKTDHKAAKDLLLNASGTIIWQSPQYKQKAVP